MTVALAKIGRSDARAMLVEAARRAGVRRLHRELHAQIIIREDGQLPE